jgi:hypothetical protein
VTYQQGAEGEPIPTETIRAMARVLDIPIYEDDLEPLSTALRDQLAAIGRIESLDLREVAPDPAFDVRWHE